MAKTDQPIIIKRVKKISGGHHGGAWKVAYADFVTAMMAFFLLLWLLNTVTQEQLEGISEYFAPASLSATTSGAGGILAGLVIAEEGAMQASSSAQSIIMELPPPKAGSGVLDEEGEGAVDADAAAELVRQREQEQFEEAEQEIRDTLDSLPQLRELAESMLIDNTPEGLRIQILDREGLAMFPRGSAEMYLHTRRVLELVAKVIAKMPQSISITGHTDSTKFGGPETGYTNWELSADRANSSRRALIELGVPPDRLARVVGMASQDPLMPEDESNPRNRRISIVLLRGTGKQPPLETEVPPQPEASPETGSPPGAAPPAQPTEATQG